MLGTDFRDLTHRVLDLRGTSRFYTIVPQVMVKVCVNVLVSVKPGAKEVWINVIGPSPDLD